MGLVMPEIIGSPGRYIQGAGSLFNLPQQVETFGTNALILVGEQVHDTVQGILNEAFADSGCSFSTEIFPGECTRSVIEDVKTNAVESGAGVVVGIGGGKVLDTAKAAAHYAGLPVIIAPSAASSDAPCSSLAVLYTDDHVFDKYVYFPSSPNVVIADTQLIAGAPPRLLASGMGDALATWFEARACARSGASNCLGGRPGSTALAIAKTCYETLLSDGLKAILAASEHTPTAAFERIVEANTYMSGIGFESGGLAAAHAIHNGLTALPGTHEMLHGEKVAFGLIAMLVMENISEKKLQLIVSFCITMGLPVTFADLGIPDVSGEDLRKVAEIAAAPDDTAHNMPFEVTPEKIYNALIGADAIGRYIAGEEEHDHCSCDGHEH